MGNCYFKVCSTMMDIGSLSLDSIIEMYLYKGECSLCICYRFSLSPTWVKLKCLFSYLFSRFAAPYCSLGFEAFFPVQSF